MIRALRLLVTMLYISGALIIGALFLTAVMSMVLAWIFRDEGPYASERRRRRKSKGA